MAKPAHSSSAAAITRRGQQRSLPGMDGCLIGAILLLAALAAHLIAPQSAAALDDKLQALLTWSAGFAHSVAIDAVGDHFPVSP